MDMFFISDLHLFYYWGPDVSLIERQIDANIERISNLKKKTFNKYPTAHEFHELDSNNKQ